MTIMIKVEAMAGDQIENVVEEMLVLRDRVQFPVTCDFNGVPLTVYQHSKTVEEVVENYRAMRGLRVKTV